MLYIPEIEDQKKELRFGNNCILHHHPTIAVGETFEWALCTDTPIPSSPAAKLQPARGQEFEEVLYLAPACTAMPITCPLGGNGSCWDFPDGGSHRD